jgi:hypothetical protein
MGLAFTTARLGSAALYYYYDTTAVVAGEIQRFFFSLKWVGGR